TALGAGAPLNYVKGRMRVMVVRRLVSLSHQIFIDGRNLDHNIFRSIGNALTTKARLQCDHGRLLELIELIIGALITTIETLLDDHMARRTGANPAAHVF